MCKRTRPSPALPPLMQASGAESSCQLAAGKTHTSFLLEGPMQGGRDLLMDVMMEVVKVGGLKVRLGVQGPREMSCTTVRCGVA